MAIIDTIIAAQSDRSRLWKNHTSFIGKSDRLSSEELPLVPGTSLADT